MEGRGKSRRRNPYQTWKRRASAMLAVLLTLSLVLGDISGLSRTVMAGQRSVKEEFRIHREAILKAAEEAIEKGELLSQPLAITSDKEKTETKYQELLAADGTVYEIFPEIEQVQDVDSLELRVFIRLEEGADPASYTLTGEEELIFLYVNGGGVTAEGRVNIDGYVSDFTEVEPLEEEDDAVWAVESGNAGSGNTGSGNAGGSGSEKGNGSVDENENAAGTENDNGNDENAGNNDGSGTMSPEDSAADLTQSADEEEVEDKTTDLESDQKPEDTLPAETEETGEAEETEADKKEDAGKPEKDPTESGADVSAETGDEAEEKETAGSTDEDGSADKDVTGDTEKEEDTDNSEKEEGTEAAGNESEDKDEDKNTSTSDDNQDENISDDDTADTNDAESADEKDDTGSTVTVSLRQIQRVAASLASDSDAEKETTGNTENGSNGSGSNGTGSTGTGGTGIGISGSAGSGNTGAGNKNSSHDSGDDEDSYYENTGDPFDEEDAAALEEEEAAFKKVKKLDGTRYDEAVLDEVLAIRAFVVSMEDAGFDKEELLDGAHHLTYTVSEGEARVVYNPEYVRDEAVVTFGIIPAEGMEVYQVTANGEVLAETERTAAIASASEAKRASSSEADVDEEWAVYYQIPEVLEDQDVQIQVVEEGYNSHPAFLKAKTINGVTITVSAEEGILPAGTELSVEEVTEQVADAVAQKITEDSTEDSPKRVTSIIAYDINLMLDGEKLPNDWSERGTVGVTFSGDRVEEISAEAEKIEIFAIDDQNEAKLNAENADSVSTEPLILEPIQEDAVIGETREAVSYQAEHFTIYIVSGTSSTDELVTPYTMQVGESITVYSNKVSYSKLSSPSWSPTNSDIITISNTTYRQVGNQWRPQATITAKKAGTVTVTVSRTTMFSGTESETFTINVVNDRKQTVTFHANGASGTVPNPITNIESGSEIELPDAGELSKNGYSFIGWSKTQITTDNQIGQGQIAVYPAGSELLVNESFTLYAVWAQKNPTVAVHFFLRLDGVIQNEPSGEGKGAYTGHYNLNGNKVEALEGMYFAADSSSQPVLKEKKFVTDPTGEAVRANLNHEPTNEAIVKAINTQPNVIQSNYGTVGNITLDEYEKSFRVIWYVVKIPINPDGYWHVDGVLLRKDQVTLTYDINCQDYSSGSKNPVGGSYDKGETETVAGNSSFSRPGYEFTGWNTKADGSGKWYQPDDTIVMLEDTVLYAQWQNATAHLVFKKVLDGGSGDVTQVSFSLYKATDTWEKDGNTPVKSGINPNSSGLVSIQLAYDAGNKKYLLYEDTPAPGYEGLAEPLKIEVSFDGNNRITYHVNGGTSNTYSASTPYEIVNNYVEIAFKVNKYLRNGTEGIDQVEKVTFQLRKLNETATDENFGKYEDFGGVVRVSLDPNASNTTISGYAVFESMPIGEYQLVELSTADGYMLHEAIDLKVALDENGDIQLWEKDENGDWVVVSKVGKNMPEITVYNEQGAELPETGGPGLIMMERFGWMLLLLAMAGMEVQIFSKRRRKE